jgi:hypothetical protein
VVGIGLTVAMMNLDKAGLLACVELYEKSYANLVKMGANVSFITEKNVKFENALMRKSLMMRSRSERNKLIE